MRIATSGAPPLQGESRANGVPPDRDWGGGAGSALMPNATPAGEPHQPRHHEQSGAGLGDRIAEEDIHTGRGRVDAVSERPIDGGKGGVGWNEEEAHDVDFSRDLSG